MDQQARSHAIAGIANCPSPSPTPTRHLFLNILYPPPPSLLEGNHLTTHFFSKTFYHFFPVLIMTPSRNSLSRNVEHKHKRNVILWLQLSHYAAQPIPNHIPVIVYPNRIRVVVGTSMWVDGTLLASPFPRGSGFLDHNLLCLRSPGIPEFKSNVPRAPAVLSLTVYSCIDQRGPHMGRPGSRERDARDPGNIHQTRTMGLTRSGMQKRTWRIRESICVYCRTVQDVASGKAAQTTTEVYGRTLPMTTPINHMGRAPHSTNYIQRSVEFTIQNRERELGVPCRT